MKNIQSYLVNKDAPSAGFSLGKFKDDSGAADGSAATQQWVNDFYYGLVGFIKKYLPGGAVSDTDESETANDTQDSVEHMVGIKNANVTEWSNIVAYVIDDHVMYLGIQFVAMIAGTGNNPIDNPDKWLPCFNRDDAMVKFRNGEDIKGGMEAVHDFRDGGYRQNYAFGKYNFGGDAGRNFESFGVHLDGTVVTLNPTLEAIFDVGGAGEYHLLDIIAPDIVGTRTLMDARGRVSRIVDAGGGDAVAVGSVQEDAMQRITGTITVGPRVFVSGVGVYTLSDTDVTGPGSAANNRAAQFDFDNDDSVSPNAAKTNDDESRMKNYSVGVVSLLVMNELP